MHRRLIVGADDSSFRVWFGKPTHVLRVDVMRIYNKIEDFRRETHTFDILKEWHDKVECLDMNVAALFYELRTGSKHDSPGFDLFIQTKDWFFSKWLGKDAR